MNYLYIFYILIFLFGCQTEQFKDDKIIIGKQNFTHIIKAIHLAEAKYEINKNKNIDAAKNLLKIEYDSIFKRYSIEVNDFERSIKHYSTKTNELDEIYENVLEELIKDKNKLH